MSKSFCNHCSNLHETNNHILCKANEDQGFDADGTINMSKPKVRILLNNNIDMTPGKAAAQAVHAALAAFGIDHGSVVVLQGSKRKLEAMDVQIHDAGLTELKPGTLTAGASIVPEADTADE